MRWLDERTAVARQDRLDSALVVYLAGVTMLMYVIGHNFYNSLYLVPEGNAIGSLAEDLAVISEGSLRRRVGIMLFGLSGLVILYRKGLSGMRWRPLLAAAVAAYLAWSSASLLWADEPGLTFRRLAALWLLVFGTVGLIRVTPRRLLPWFIGVTSALFGLFGIGAELLLGTFAPFGEGYRFSGTLHPNAQGISAAFAVLSGIWLISRRHRPAPLMGWVLCGFGTLLVLLTRSRSSFAALIGAALFLLVLQMRPGRRIVAGVLIANGAIVLGLLYANGMLEGLLQPLLLGRNPADLVTLNSRVPLWEVLFDFVAQEPFRGYGFSGFMTPRHAAEIAVLLEFGIAGAHSIYLETLLGIGAVGLVSFLLMFGAGIVTGSGRARDEGGAPDHLFAAILAFELLNGILDSSMIFPSWRILTLVVLGALCCVRPSWSEPRLGRRIAVERERISADRLHAARRRS